MSLLDSIVKKGEDLATAGLQMGSDLVHTVETAVVNNVVKPVEKAVASLTEPAENLGAKLVHEAYSALGNIPKAIVQAVSEPAVGLIGAIFPGAALVAIGFNTWKDLANGSTVKVDQSITAEQQLKASGLAVSASNASGQKLDLNGIFKRAESGTVTATVTDGRAATTAGGGGEAGVSKPVAGAHAAGSSSSDSSAAFNLISRSEWANILPDLTAPCPDVPSTATRDSRASRDQVTTQLPRADVAQGGIDFKATAAEQGKLEIVNSTVFYRSSEANVESKDGHFTIEQANGYTFKDDGNGGRIVYHNGVEVYDQHKDGSREFNLPGGVKLKAQGESLTVTDSNGNEEHLTRNLVNQALEHRVGKFLVQQTAEHFTAVMARKLPSSQTVMLGADFVEMQQGAATAIIRDSGEAFAYTDTQVLHRDINGKWYYKATKTAPEQEIKLADLSTTTGDAALVALVQKVDQLIGHGNAEIGGQQMSFRRGRIQTNLRDTDANQSATLLVTNNESAITDNSTGLTWTRTANSPDTKLSLAGKQLATVTDGKDEKVTTPEVVSTNEKTVVADGSVINKDMSMDLSSHIHVTPQADIRLADGTTIGHDGIVRTAQGDTISSQAMAQQITNTMAAAASALASIGSGAGVSMAKIIELESLLGSVKGLLAMCNSIPADFPLATNLEAFSSRLEGTIGIAKDNFTKQSGRQFVQELNSSANPQYTRFAFLNNDAAA